MHSKNRTVMHFCNSIVGDSWVLYLNLSIDVDEDELVYGAFEP